jgi:Family of unknown function (DUF6527)
MGVKVRPIVSGTEAVGWLVWCPACDHPHQFTAKMPNGSVGWTFDGNLESPTFNPSLRARWDEGEAPKKVEKCCHANLIAGVWRYAGDSTHAFKGQRVPALDWPSSNWGS